MRIIISVLAVVLFSSCSVVDTARPNYLAEMQGSKTVASKSGNVITFEVYNNMSAEAPYQIQWSYQYAGISSNVIITDTQKIAKKGRYTFSVDCGTIVEGVTIYSSLPNIEIYIGF